MLFLSSVEKVVKINMNLIKQNKFSENMVSFRYLLPLDRKTITAYNLLCYMLKSKTELYPDKNHISVLFNRNYGAKLSIGLSSYGNILCMQYRFQYIRPDWIESDSYKQNMMEIMDQFLFHPILTKENFEEAKFLLKNRLRMQKDDPLYESIVNAFTLIDEHHSISIPVQGIYDDIDAIQLEEVEALYTKMKDKKPYVYACGIFEDEMLDYLDSISNQEPVLKDYTILNVDTYQEKIVTKDIEQTCITKVYATSTDALSKDYDALLLMNSVFGQSPINLLFQEVREKHSFCYSIGSNVIRFDGVLYVYVGCKREHIEEILNLVDIQLQRVIDMEYRDELLDIAKKDWKDAMVAGLDNQISHVERRFMSQILDRHSTMEERMRVIDALTKEDLSRAAKKLKAVSLSIVQEEA